MSGFENISRQEPNPSDCVYHSIARVFSSTDLVLPTGASVGRDSAEAETGLPESTGERTRTDV